jgi:enamine deaminase RidA (YjgF/YER057c/UK114 family)
MKYFIEMNNEYEKWFSHKPARSCIAVKGLPNKVDVEIEATAITWDGTRWGNTWS